MTLLSRKTRYALDAVVNIAQHARPNPVQSKDIAERQGIPQRYLESVMQHLVRKGILRGVRGPRGGYRLARERRRISVGEVIRFVTDLERREESWPNGSGSKLGQFSVFPRLQAAEERMLTELDSITIEDVCRETKDGFGKIAKSGEIDFSI